MKSRRIRMIEDKYLRDSARELVKADFENLKADYANKSLSERAFDRVKEGALDLYEEAAETAQDRKGTLAILFGGLLIWFARHPIMALFESDEPEGDRRSDDEHWAEH